MNINTKPTFFGKKLGSRGVRYLTLHLRIQWFPIETLVNLAAVRVTSVEPSVSSFFSELRGSWDLKISEKKGIHSP